ncbi:PGF-CTERM-anchored ABC transporter substrate-binding protein [Halobacterium wangiae]|uniref:PGF-CTERM-anchored ABC transporter substrate-binding protein n=1 Tax=Halobacterium wangiae TaxID=2902623 RepID=UPI001E59EFD8|nr:PGF-CTERM-anchored ABC transporter substrate-binding protein [Halobacterium wangiae]
MHRTATAVGVVLLILSAVVPAAGAAGAIGAQDGGALECEFPLTDSDASDHQVTVDAEPERVVTLNPSAAQTMWEIGGREKVVGISQFGGYLEGAESREVVTSGFPSTVNVEQVISLDPDLVLAPNTIDNDSVQQIRGAGITVYRFELADSVDSIYNKTQLIGQLTGECAGAEETVSEMRDRVQTVEEAVAGEERPRVYWGTEAGYTAGPNTFVGQIIERAGGHNVANEANTSQPYPQLSEEFIAQQDPEFVVVSVPPEQLGNDSRSYIPQDSVVRNTTAWEEGNIVVVDTNHLSQPAPRIVEPMTQMAQAFHPEAYADANTTTTTTAAPTTTTADATTTADTTDDESGGGVPGFGVPAAVVAVLGAALLARR